MIKTEFFSETTRINLLILSVRLLSVSGAVIWATYPNLYLININKLYLIYIYNIIIYIYTIFFIIRFFLPTTSKKCELFCLFTFMFDQIVISYLTYVTGGFSSPFYSGYFVVITISAFVLGIRASLITAATGAIFYVIFNLSYGVGLYNMEEIIYRIIPFFVIVFPTGILSDLAEKHFLEIDNLNSQLKQKNCKLEESLKKIESIQKQLIKKEKEEALLEMAESIAHRLRNPLMSIGGIASVLDKKLRKDISKGELTKYIEYIRYIKEESKGMSILINNLLAMSEKNIEFKFVSIEKLINSIINKFKKSIIEGNILLDLEIDSNLPPIRTDERKLRVAIRSIVDNCVKILRYGGRLGIFIRKSEELKNMIEIIIKDNGPGIPRDLLKNIFKPFESGGKEKKGIGLSLAKHSIEIIGGELYIESKIGEGTTFKIIIPM